ncbi:pyrroline-5-carboxylate reductase [Intestinibacillus sp. Marseille-P6563]|uniref:pyrroline-5-carboxylate reductase n=1 Tax=Intestinibacillus sp. Marseille-P6563 TaxID=2364792 RepID=UPI0013DEB463|nr:pyrroline-5-carboxylate reductase [Intestinibacillus sp. Marseille-P6563]
MKQYQLGVIGAGNMGMAIARGMVAAGTPASSILLFNRSPEKRAARAAEGFAVTEDYISLYTACDTVLLAVKPQNFDEVLGQLAPVAANCRPLVLSVAAGVTFAKMQAALGADCPVIRIMPNTPLMLGEGATELVKNAAATDEQLARVRALFDTLGVTVVFDAEEKLNDVIPFAGSAPAYIYAFADAMVRSAEQVGIDREDALKLFCQTLIGSAKMMLRGDQTPAELVQAVCSPGGTTLEAMKVLRERGLDDMLDEANRQCIRRAYELGQ